MNGKQAAETIKNTFLANMDKLSPYKRSHFAIRLFRANGDTAHLYYVHDFFESIKKGLFQDMKNFDDEEYALKRAEFFFNDLNPAGTKKGSERQKVFSCRRTDLFYLKLIEIAHIANQIGVFQEEHQEDYQRWLDFLRKKDLKSIFFDDDVFKHYSTQLIILAYQLKFNNVIDLTQDFKKKFSEVFMEKENLDDYDYKNKIYTMTHFIIGASDYYQQFVPDNEFDWVLDYFIENFEEIIKRTNVDIIAEVGICLKLAGIYSGKEIERVAEYILEDFNSSKGYIPRGEGDLLYSEHANSVAYLFLAGLDILYKGPCFNKNK